MRLCFRSSPCQPSLHGLNTSDLRTAWSPLCPPMCRSQQEEEAAAAEGAQEDKPMVAA